MTAAMLIGPSLLFLENLKSLMLGFFQGCRDFARVGKSFLENLGLFSFWSRSARDGSIPLGFHGPRGLIQRELCTRMMVGPLLRCVFCLLVVW